eukprot:CAMPEP_0118892290 /NCGR_PEP_ID=MMETSP1166-20130328/1944_1 /TAXON_ID=1104430 /ORGANISM="Chrysoreinhardia sp, Strain CCMP3193" /LENGTH=540 /DNA_ID=CAMNT_0006830999 /DNA_START=16 /DNA_END=1638 /DNA_ORIENTATION=-
MSPETAAAESPSPSPDGGTLAIMDGEDSHSLAPPPRPAPRPPSMGGGGGSPLITPVLSSLMSAGGPPLRVRDYSDVELVKLRVSRPVPEGKVIKTYSYTLTSRARYAGTTEEMAVQGGALKRTLHDFLWCKSALASSFPGVVVPPVTTDACVDAEPLNLWFERCLRHPALRSSSVLKCFALSPPSEFRTSQREYSTYYGLAPLNVQLQVLFMRGKDLSSGRDDEDPRTRWIADETAKLETCLAATEDSLKTDQKAARLSNATSRLLTVHLAGSGSIADKFFPPEGQETPDTADTGRTNGHHHHHHHLGGERNNNDLDDDDHPDGNSVGALPAASRPRNSSSGGGSASKNYGPAMAAPLLRDALGYLQSAGEAVHFWQDVGRCVRAARANVEKRERSKNQREEYLKKAEDRKHQAKAADASSQQDATQKAKQLLTSLSLKASAAASKTAANLSATDQDVANAKALLEDVEKKYKEASAALDAEFPALKDYWPHRLRSVFDAYAQGEKMRASSAQDLATILLVECGGGFSPEHHRNGSNSTI